MRELTGQPGPAGPPRPRRPLKPWLLGWIDSDDDPRQEMDSLPGVMWHLSDAWARGGEPNVLLFHYGDLSADLAGQMRRLAGERASPCPGRPGQGWWMRPRSSGCGAARTSWCRASGCSRAAPPSSGAAVPAPGGNCSPTASSGTIWPRRPAGTAGPAGLAARPQGHAVTYGSGGGGARRPGLATAADHPLDLARVDRQLNDQAMAAEAGGQPAGHRAEVARGEQRHGTGRGERHRGRWQRCDRDVHGWRVVEGTMACIAAVRRPVPSCRRLPPGLPVPALAMVVPPSWLVAGCAREVSHLTASAGEVARRRRSPGEQLASGWGRGAGFP